MKKIYLNLYFYTFFVVFSAVSIPVLTLIVALSAIFISRHQVMRLFRRFISLYGRVVVRLPFPFIKVYYSPGNENDSPGPFIFVCNHRSVADAFLISCLPFEVVQVVDMWPFHIPVLGRYAKLAGYLNIKAISHEEFLEEALQLLKGGTSIVFFPEGTRSVNREIGTFHSTAFRLALQSQAPVIPICLSGTEQVLPKGSRMLSPGKIRVKGLSAINWQAVKDLSAYSFKNMVRGIIHDELAVMEQTSQASLV